MQTPPPPPRKRPNVLVRMTLLAWLLGVLVVGANDHSEHFAMPELQRQANRDSSDPSDTSSFSGGIQGFYPKSPVSAADSTLLASTLDGGLVAIDKYSGHIRWRLEDEPVVKSPFDPKKAVLPAFLPDPKDGSIYMIGGQLKEPLKKLPFTIPELVAASPCKSSDGILYTGKKVDTWFTVDRRTGSKQGSISFAGCVSGEANTCPNLSPSNFLIGRTEYNIMMYDSKAEGSRNSWNISFFDYSSLRPAGDKAYRAPGVDYELAHFTDSSTGALITLDRLTGAVQWERHLGSPVVAMFRMDGDNMFNVPFTSVSKETLGHLLEQFNQPEKRNEEIGETKLFPTLYVGEHDHGLYAMPSLVDERTFRISPVAGPPLLEGPVDANGLQEARDNFVMDETGKIHFKHAKGHQADPYAIPVDQESRTIVMRAMEFILVILLFCGQDF